MLDSILNSTKKNLGIAEDYEVFDSDIIVYINNAFSTLNQLGIGPLEGFGIQSDEETWDDYLKAESRLNSVKTYVYLRVKVLFDPPGTSFVLTALQEQIKELEWRITAMREELNSEVI